jgi:hypothetical protein
MSSLLAPETLAFFARCVLAGYVVIFMRAILVVGLPPRPADLLTDAAVLSLIVQLVAFLPGGVWSLGARLWWSPEAAPAILAAPPRDLVPILRMLVVPCLISALFGHVLQSGLRFAVLRRLSLPVVPPARRAHDVAFGVDRQPGLVKISFEDGTRLGGRFGEASLAATDDARSDLYPERKLSDRFRWQLVGFEAAARDPRRLARRPQHRVPDPLGGEA